MRRVLLRGRDTGRFGLLLSFEPRRKFGGSSDGWLVAGHRASRRRALLPGAAGAAGAYREPAREPGGGGPRPDGARDVAGLLDDWAAALAGDPWLTEWPALVAGTPVAPGAGWQFVDPAGLAVPLLGQESR